VPTIPLDLSGRKRAAFEAVSGLLQRREVDVVHAHNGAAAFFSCLALARAGRGSVVATQHFIKPAREGRKGVHRAISSLAHSWVNARISRWIAISDAVASGIHSRGDCPGGRIRVVPNGVPAPDADEPERAGARSMIGLEAAPPVVVCVARLEEEKGHLTLLRALALLRAEGLDFRAALVGEGSLRSSLEAEVRSLALDGLVRLVGHQDRPGVWMKAADVLVLPSPGEPFGLALTEAMSRGLPVVGAASGGPLEIICPQSGFLFQPGDPRDLAFSLLRLLRDRPLREEMGAAGRRRWARFYGVERMVGEVASVYREVA
jgi:glycosyltransferase involved in cell wall biosynthesis